MLSMQANKVVRGQKEELGTLRQREWQEQRPRVRERAWGVLELQVRACDAAWRAGEVAGGTPGG